MKIRDEVVDPELQARGINHCEFLGYLPGECSRFGRLQRCHSKKRRKLVSDADWAEVAAGCQAHHDYLDLVLDAEEMKAAVQAAIARRPPPIDFSIEEERQATGGEVKEVIEPLPYLETPF